MSDEKKSEFDHATLAKYKGLHRCAQGYGGGRCLLRHKSEYTENNSCSYRWQAVRRALGEDREIYGVDDDDVKTNWVVGTTASRYQDKGIATPENLFCKVKSSYRTRTIKEGEVKIKKKVQVIETEVEMKPFRSGFSPWSNAVHHLVPIACIRHAIKNVSSGESVLEAVIVQELMKGDYNINHTKNQMILPQLFKHALSMGLPTHARGDYHGKYSNSVKNHLVRIFDAYKSEAKSLKTTPKDHPPLPGSKQLVKKIEKLSIKLHKLIVDSRDAMKAKAEKLDRTNGKKILPMGLDSLHSCVAKIAI